ncbi:hypothetical protein FG379_002770 [Cryptosporidium bovis]|uniref:uncharacterized protein n=1 Tax=Cryptosporidium bovis TaxID=310047 RepID=UPI00351A8EC3|nr:hypothetical protein FG379_002770 [Cryptosporidium bovis]
MEKINELIRVDNNEIGIKDGAKIENNDEIVAGVENGGTSCIIDNLNMENEPKFSKGEGNLENKNRIETENVNVGYEWCNELLSFPNMFNNVFSSLYRYNEYIDQRWLLIEDNYNKLVELLLEISRNTSLEEEKNNMRSEFICLLNNTDAKDGGFIIKEMFLNKENVEYRSINDKTSILQYIDCVKNKIKIEINTSSDDIQRKYNNVMSNNSDFLQNMEINKHIYCDLYNKYQTSINDIDITFDRKEEILLKLNSRLKMIISSIELFMKNNPGILESNVKPIYNISNTELVDLNLNRKKSNTRGRPPGSVTRGRPPGSTNSNNNNLTKKNIIKRKYYNLS